MKRVLCVLLILAVTASGFAGCRQSRPGAGTDAREDEDNKLRVVAAVFPGYDFTREIAGDLISLTMLLPPGSESHSFEPTPKDIITVESCDVFLYVGGESDTWVKGILESVDTSNMVILSMMDMVDVVEEEWKEGMDVRGDANNNEEEESAEYDEHVWTSPRNAIRIVRAIEDTLCALDRDNAEAYKANADAYTGKLEGLDASFHQIVGEALRHTLIFGDRFPFRYFTEEYGLDYYGAFPGCSAETEPSAKTVAFLIDKVRDETIPVVFHIEFSNEKIADAICEGTGAKKMLFHSCHNVTKMELERGVSYLELMEQNAANLKEALL